MTNLQKMDNLSRKVDKMADNLSLAHLLPLSGCKRKYAKATHTTLQIVKLNLGD